MKTNKDKLDEISIMLIDLVEDVTRFEKPDNYYKAISIATTKHLIDLYIEDNFIKRR